MTVALLRRSFDAVASLVDGIEADQWSAPTPCTDWDVRRLVHHLVGMNRVFTAMLTGGPMPERDEVVPDLPSAFRSSSEELLEAFGGPGVLERSFEGPLGSATGEERLMIRLYDLLAHGWDLAVATGRPVELPEDAAEAALVFVRGQLRDEARPGRFAPAVVVPADASAIERLVAFLGRPVG